ncbi:hypothetical protein [Loktanella sp. R86503]|uniref:hypothetical protein n=1 Tax=Loktanella sp. R86503 TaxID=3093847 RepID=UPI0036DDFB3A
MIPASLRRTGQAIALALSLLSFSGGLVSAHGLPGTVLILSADDDQLKVAVQVPVDELIIAAPALVRFEKLPADRDLPADQLALLDEYFALHFKLAANRADLPLTLLQASLQNNQSVDHGAYSMLIANFAAPHQGSDNIFPLQLTYDAVMHEIRSHSATVYWQAADADPIGIAEFYYQEIDGNLAKQRLTLP